MPEHPRRRDESYKTGILSDRHNPTIEVRRLTKRFGATVALDKVDAQFRAGEIHAVLGENGAGKSTLVSVLSGIMQPDKGDIVVSGRTVALRSAADASRSGISLVHQHFTLVRAFTVAENLALQQARLGGVLLNVDAMAASALDLAKSLGWSIDPRKRVESLSVGEQQRVEILKALASGRRVVMFDEPTSTLVREEIDDLFHLMRKLRDAGTTIVLIAHKLAEVLEVSDRVTILRRGQIVASDLATSECSAEDLAELMVGHAPPMPSRERRVHGKTESLRAERVEVLNDRGQIAVRAVSFEVGEGEILGIGGVDGNGQAELAEALAGVRSISSGELYLPCASHLVAYLPQDRRRDGLALHMSIRENLLIEGHRQPNPKTWGLLLPMRVRAWCEEIVRNYDIRTTDIDAPAASLSGGNQQKVVVARVMSGEPRVIIAVSPTRGLDLRATQYVRNVLRSARDQGAFVVLFTTDLDELAELSDRVLIMSGGRLLEGQDMGLLLGGVE